MKLMNSLFLNYLYMCVMLMTHAEINAITSNVNRFRGKVPKARLGHSTTFSEHCISPDTRKLD